MRLRAVIASAVTAVVSAGVLVATSTAAHAAIVPGRFFCWSNQNHYTSADFTIHTTGQLLDLRWKTVEAFHPDRITFSGYHRPTNSWTLLIAIGGSAESLNDVNPSGSRDLGPTEGSWSGDTIRMSVFDRAMGNCSVSWRFRD